MRISIALCLPGDAETVSLVRTIAVQTLDQLGVASDCLDDIRLALGEACANVIAHADTTDDYEVRLDVDGDQCAIRVIDSGHGFDITTLTDAMPDPASPSGRGLALMRALVDRIEFTSQPETGTLVHLTTTLDLTPGGPLDQLRPHR